MATVHIRWYTVKMPDGKKYTTEGRGRKKVAERHGVSMNDVSIGAELFGPNAPRDISEYYASKAKAAQ